MSAATMKPGAPSAAPPSHRTLYIVVGAVVAALALFGVIAYDTAQDNQAAQDMALQLTQSFEQAGLPVPADQEQIVATLGDDGGAVCANPANALGKALLLDSLANGASFVGRRPVIADSKILLGEALILQIYCPDKLAPYQAKIDALKTDTTIKP